eukprot:5027149-Amphidinium_carterae.1
MVHDRKNWMNMEAGVKEPGYTAIKIPMMYEPNPTKGRHCAHEVRKEAIMEVIDDMGMDNFVAAINDQIKSGEVIEWDDPEREGAQPAEIGEVGYDMKLNYYVKLKLPTDIEQAVWRRTEAIAA